ncbi:unnamed protein product [Heterobilharzia americana]|nr:unnamed protein product [Heterobilharzia americana]
MKVNSEVIAAYDALTAIGQLFLTTDISMLPLDIANLKRQFPDIRPDQAYALLMARGDVGSDNAKGLSADTHYGRELSQRPSPFTIFTRLAVAMDQH